MIRILMLLIIVSGCATSSKSSNPDFMVGKATTTSESEILKDLVREADIERRVGLTMTEEQSGLYKEKFRRYPANATVQVYPYTEPLVTVRIHERTADQGFKEAWSEEKTKSEYQRRLAKAFKQFSGKQCFAFIISSENPEAIETKYWSAVLRQGSLEQPLSFAKGDGFVEETKTLSTTTTNNVTTGKVHTNRKYNYFADACAPNPINLLESFSIEMTPRFRRDLLNVRLEWLAKKKNGN